MSPSPSDPAARPADWEAFYRDYRKPGYVPGFEITTKLGGGMFGLVFRARRMSIGKDYAIKFLQVDDGEVRKAVLSELEQVKWFAQIDHPNLVSIEDRGEVDGIPFLVMAFAGTETLRDKMAGKVPGNEEKDELLRFFLQACRGLAALHERSLVHFDIKPANVFLKGAVARLGDYGLSKLVTHSRGSLSMGRGTPYYMAPEMLQRRGDHRSDIYSLGVMLYELLCGKVPFTGDSEWEVLKKHETEVPAMPVHLTAREQAILHRCLQKDPAARYSSVHDLIAAFGAPASAGAAAWTDLRSASAAPNTNVPPPLTGTGASGPSSVPPPGAGGAQAGGANSAPPPGVAAGKPEEDPYAGLGRASRDALRHAGTIAQKAAQEASKLAHKAAEKARTMIREGAVVGRKRGLRRLFALRRLGKHEKDHDARAHWMEAAGEIGTPPLPPSRRRFRRWGVAGTLVAAVVVFGVMMLTMSGGPRMVYAPFSMSVDEPPPPARSSRQTFNTFRVNGYTNYVSLSEPEWVAMAQRDRDMARSKLLAHIEQLREKAPLEQHKRTKATNLPFFAMSAEDRRDAKSIESTLAAFLNNVTYYDKELARKLERQAPRALALAAEQLARTDWSQPVARARAARLQQWLEETTSCHDLPLFVEGGASAEQLAKANRNLGEMWLWFVNEFAHTPRTWETFRSLMAKH